MNLFAKNKRLNRARIAALTLAVASANTFALELDHVVGHQAISIAANTAQQFALPLHKIAAYEGPVASVSNTTLSGEFPSLPQGRYYLQVISPASSAYGKVSGVTQNDSGTFELSNVITGLMANDRVVVRAYTLLADVAATPVFSDGATLTTDPDGAAQTYTWSVSDQQWQDVSNQDASLVRIPPGTDIRINHSAQNPVAVRFVGELVTTPWN